MHVQNVQSEICSPLLFDTFKYIYIYKRNIPNSKKEKEKKVKH